MEKIVQIKNLQYGYSSGKLVLNTFDVDLLKGKIYLLAGHNGAGKTTFFRLLNGLIFKWRGEINCMGYDPEGRDPDMLSKIFLAGDFNFFPKCDVERLSEKLGFYYPDFNKDQFESYLRMFHVSKTEKIHALSQGQMKKVTLAFAFATNVPLLLLDEPTNALDIEAKHALRKILNQWITPEKTCVIASHQIRELDIVVDHFMILADKKIAFSQDLGEILSYIAFGLERDELSGSDLLYYEKHPSGYLTIRKSNPDYDSLDVNIELLYNAFIAKKQEFTLLFNSTPHEK